jgi:hypothetical protein
MPVSRLVITFFIMFGSSTVGLFRKFVLFGGSLVRIVHGLSPVEENVNSRLMCTRRAKHFCMRNSLSGIACLFQWRQRCLVPLGRLPPWGLCACNERFWSPPVACLPSEYQRFMG